MTAHLTKACRKTAEKIITKISGKPPEVQRKIITASLKRAVLVGVETAQRMRTTVK